MSFGTKAGNWSRDFSTDTYTYNYPCGHGFRVPVSALARGGQVAPPLCPTCHKAAVIDRMEAENWRANPKWAGYAPGQPVQGLGEHDLSNSLPGASPFPPKKSGPSIKPGLSANSEWLDLQVGSVRERAWR